MDLAGWAWLGILFGVGVIELALTRRHHPTLSQWLRRVSTRHPWVKWACVGALAFLAYHLFWQPASHFWDDPPPAPVVAPAYSSPCDILQ